MKGAQGLIVAVGLGICGVVLNFAYLAGKGREIQMVSFIAIKPDVTVEKGRRLTADNLEQLSIPSNAVGNLTDFAYSWKDLSSVSGLPIYRTLTGPHLLLREDMRTPESQLVLEKDEHVMWVPVDTRSFNAGLLVPNEDLVSFVVPRARPNLPTPAAAPATAPAPASGAAAGGPAPVADPAEADDPATQPAGATELVGPFKVLSLGSRLGQADLFSAAKVGSTSPGMENVMGISVKMNNVERMVNGQKTTIVEFEPKAQKLADLMLLHARQFGVVLYERKSAKK